MKVFTLVVFLLIYEVIGFQPHNSVKYQISNYLKTAPWEHVKTFAKIKTPLSLDITSNYRLPAGTILTGLKVVTGENCADILRRDPSTRKKDGIYKIILDRKKIVKVYCDMTTDRGGWTVIQNRFDGTTNFYRDWNDYKTGFGNISREFWLGNDIIHALTKNDDQELRVEMTKFSGSKVYAKYSKFSIGDESKKYKLSISGYSGSAGDFIIGSHSLNGMAFSTKDIDNDKWGGQCAKTFQRGAWWYNSCSYSNLNGQYTEKQLSSKTHLFWGSSRENMKSSRMMIRTKS
ncbi:fibrinogen-like protein A [Saccostrea cucullata]|uniref:fibrinogen-like protein A n=1 Tax=Saccostrea cuccullata TaxID=36930 RepID=UPI002ECFE6A5